MKKTILIGLMFWGTLAYSQQHHQPLDTVTVHMNEIYFQMDWQGLNELLATFNYMELEEIYDPRTGLTHYDIKKEERPSIEDWEPCVRRDD